MTEPGEDESGKRCVAAAWALSVAHILTLIGTDYQVYRPGMYQIDYAFFVNYATFLSPLVILFALRRICIALLVLAIPILIFFAYRTHYVWQFYWSGINSMARQKGDALGFINMVFDMASLFMAAPILLFIVLHKLVEVIQRIKRGAVS
jgi:hypothetical protein